ncbi:hypothetical protein [Halococcus hamelinensis]|uniref:Uncharacterized protein n=1 Tax=Halococcus hamelinensis 100A6 TaxID=1132509 RepID=M0LZ70_9EURY|nr:hypothetical protein [Halococcus hamelinensis]EMA38453.1 hypothetical protein C447_09872 [Halococcus hamelinensis 100A6]
MTDALVCNRCGEAVPREEWKRNLNGTIEFNFLEAGTMGEYERGPKTAHLCGECAGDFADECDIEIPDKWTRGLEDDQEGDGA